MINEKFTKLPRENSEAGSKSQGGNLDKKEGTMERGHKVSITMSFIRHGEKSSIAGGLSEAGEAKLREEYSKRDWNNVDRVKLGSANLGRNIQTLRIIEESVPDEKLGTSHIDKAFGYWPEKMGGINDNTEPVDISDGFLGKLYDIHANSKSGGENELVQYYIDFESERPDEGTISPREIASKIARRVSLQARMAKRLYDDSKVEFIQVTGSLPFYPFLEQLIGDQVESSPVNPEGRNFTERVGGTWGFGEGVQIVAETDVDGVLMPLRVTFRGKEYMVDAQSLEKIAKSEDVNISKFRLPQK